MPSLSATSFEHDLTRKEFGSDWLDPAKKLLCVAFVVLDEVSPLPAETFSRRLFVAVYVFQIGKSRNAMSDGEITVTASTRQRALEDLLVLCSDDVKRKVLTAAWTH